MKPKPSATPRRHPASAAIQTGDSFRVIALAASAGGLQALSVILGGRPAGFAAGAVILMHQSPDDPNILAETRDGRTNVFDPYFAAKTRGRQKGKSLGLAISHATVHSHRDAMSADSTEGTRTTLHRRLPAIRSVPDESAA